MRLYPRSKDPHQPRKKGETVDSSFCHSVPRPQFVQKTKPCKRQCDTPKWIASTWSKVS